MSELDLDSLLEPVSATDPSGEDPAYTPDFQQLENAAGGQPEQVMGDSVKPAVPPDWKQVAALGTDLLSRGKDLRIAVLIGRALLHREGFAGLASGIALIRRLLAEYWDSVHPRPDPEDKDDFTERMNALLDLCDQDAVLAPARVAPLVQSPAFGAVSLRDIQIARGEAPVPANAERASLDAASVDAAFLDCELAELRRTGTIVASAVGDLDEIERIITERIGVSGLPDFGPLRDLLSHADDLLRTKITERAGTDDAQPEATASADEDAPAATSHPGGGSTTPGGGGGSAVIAGREDVVRMLDRICEYYARHEPSSPIPLLLQRARRLVTKDFMDIMQDLAPDALAQVEIIRGPQEQPEPEEG
ncbi:MAG: type VI secretion system protein TssA [Candidatus Thiosymbion ectosymbiont of Robbea hypermnestra]|nr:type VI secretion system protein TssA [Candidatus Thiosymbion ectosymbiont of Robbea hypermnestra]